MTPLWALVTFPDVLVRGAGWVIGALVFGCAAYVATSYLLAFAVIHRGKLPLLVLVRAACGELAAALLLIPLWPLWWLVGGSYHPATAGVEGGRAPALGGRRPVVLLHGFAMNRSQWLWTGWRLAARGAGPLYGLSYFSLQPVERSARELERFVESVRAREGSERVDILAHSLGGVVARYYIEHLGGAARVGRLITIGAPHGGTLLGRAARFLSVGRALSAGSPPFAPRGTPADGVAYTSIWSRADAMVVPAESSSIVPHGVDGVFDDLGHLSMILSPRVIDLVAERLAS